MTSPSADPAVLMVSKPVVPPWNDSGKNLVRDVAAHTPGYRFHVMTTRGAEPPAEGLRTEPIYGAPGSYRPSLRQNLRVLGRLLRPDGLPLYHFFFAPNPRTSTMARWVLRLKRRRSVHTICSRPASFETVGNLMFADRIVALSAHTRARLVQAGVENVVHIPPAVPDAPPVAEAAKSALRERHGWGDAPVVLYAGDFEFSDAAQAVAEAAIRLLATRDARVVFACRAKQEASAAIEARLRDELGAAGVGDRTCFLGELDDVRTLLATADVHVQPAGSLYAKMDLPLVLLESLREGVPVVVGDNAPLDEVIAHGGGCTVAPEDGEALAATLTGLLDDHEALRRLGEEARAAYTAHYDVSRQGAAYAALYDELLSATTG